MDYIDSPRHANYVESHAYQTYLADMRDRFSWNDVDEKTFDDLAGSDTAAGVHRSIEKDATHA
jgi:hypothetical protein